MTRLAPVVVAAFVVSTACSGKGSPTAPTPSTPTPPAATLLALTGSVSATTGARIPGATVAIQDGVNAGKSTSTDTSGNYRFGDLTSGNANLAVSAPGYLPTGAGVFVNGINALHFTLTAVPVPPPPPPPLFKKSGTGDTVFTIPSSVQIIKISATFNGNAQNFIVQIAGDLIVNELMGTAFGQTTFTGTYLTNGGTVQITSSSGVAWSFTEVR